MIYPFIIGGVDAQGIRKVCPAQLEARHHINRPDFKGGFPFLFKAIFPGHPARARAIKGYKRCVMGIGIDRIIFRVVNAAYQAKIAAQFQERIGERRNGAPDCANKPGRGKGTANGNTRAP